jgi:dTDP-4-dehydrorhamnose reductase
MLIRNTFILFLLFSMNIQSSTVLFYGSKGWIGQKIIAILQEQGHTVHAGAARIEEREKVNQEIESFKPDYIINSAGKIGRPNVEWCETNKEETIRSNVLGLTNLVDLAYLHNIHITNIATGCIYVYDEKHPLGSGIGFAEDEKPNFSGSFYSKTKALAEELILVYPNVLNLRVRLPVAQDFSQNSFIGKIIAYKKLVNIPNSMSVLEDLLPLIPEMLQRKLTGNYNFVNPGTISHHEVIELYKKYINPDHQYEGFTLDEHNKMMKVPRSHCELSAEKLLKQFPDVPHIKDAMKNLFEAVAKEKKGLI